LNSVTTALIERTAGRRQPLLPVDPRLLGFDEDAERDLFGVRRGELVGGELVGELNLVRLVSRCGRLEINDGPHVVEFGDEVDDADEGSSSEVMRSVNDCSIAVTLTRRGTSSSRNFWSKAVPRLRRISHESRWL
jgi:hypothetical protein